MFSRLLDLPDAVELQQAITRRAAERAEEGDTEDLDARRASALGDLARGHLNGEQPVGPRKADLVVHLHPGRTDQDLVEVGTTRTLAHLSDLQRWLVGAHVTVKPVIDLHHLVLTDAYRPTDAIAEHVRLRDPRCVFPWCNRPAERCDLDHVDPYDDDGPPGQTASDRLAPACRRHHRAKTHGRWRYEITAPGIYRFHGPHAQSWTTTALTTRRWAPD